MIRNIICAVLGVFASLAATRAQSIQQPEFEVISIKPIPPQPGRVVARLGGDAGRIEYSNVTLKDVLRVAYNVRRYQVDAPSWADSERYHITAKVPDGVSSRQIPAMLQGLLRERFRVALRREKRKRSVYAISVAKGGLRLGKLPNSASAEPEQTTVRTSTSINPDGSARLELKEASMAAFADTLAGILGRPVLDQTGIDGRYDIAIDGSIDEIMTMRRSIPGSEPEGHGPRAAAAAIPLEIDMVETHSASLFAAVRKLGLKIESRKAPVEYLVIQDAQRVPVEN